MTLTVRANGADIPAIGLGTWAMRGQEAVGAVHAALEQGYRHIDTAAMYGNEVEIGEAIRAHTTPQREIFLTTKVWPNDAAEGRLQRSAEASLKRLGVDQVDLLLIHWPNPDVSVQEQVVALCDAKKQGFARHIGVYQSKLHATCLNLGISMTSYTPLGRGGVLRHPVIQEIARAKGKTAAQVVLRWHIEQPFNIAIPKSSNPRRIAENIDIFDFALMPEEMGRISSLARADGRVIEPVTTLD
jgi:diketogulonate reductase-like aldo/keto reductase